MSKRRIVLSNSYGTQNVGDEAILTVLVNELSGRGFDVDILTFTPRETQIRQEKATVIRSGVIRGSLSTIGAIRRASVLVVGGGGIIQDATSFGNLLLHVSRPLMAALTGTPVVISGVGVGPLNRSLSRKLVRWACNRASSIDVRDSHSAALLEAIGVPDERVRQSADFAHLLEKCSVEEMDEVGRALINTLQLAREKGRLLVGLSLRPPIGDASRRSQMTAGDRSHLEHMARVADGIVEKYDAQIIFVSMHAEQDDSIASFLVKEMQHRDRVSLVSGKLQPAVIKAAIAELDLMIGMRLHSLIFAACHEVPFVALAYDDKVAAYCEALGLPVQALRPAQGQAESILSVVDRTLASSLQIREQLRSAVPQLAANANQSIDKICEIALAKC